MWASKTTNIAELRAQHCSPKGINGVHWALACIELQCMSSFTRLCVKFCCVGHWIALHNKLCYVALQTMLRHATLYTLLHYIAFKFHCATLQALLYNITLHFKLYYVTNSTTLHYNFARLSYTMTLLQCITNYTILSCKFYCATLCVMLCCVSNSTMLH
jgi:hypothetical protein